MYFWYDVQIPVVKGVQTSYKTVTSICNKINNYQRNNDILIYGLVLVKQITEDWSLRHSRMVKANVGGNVLKLCKRLNICNEAVDDSTLTWYIIMLNKCYKWYWHFFSTWTYDLLVPVFNIRSFIIINIEFYKRKFINWVTFFFVILHLTIYVLSVIKIR